MDAEKPGSTLRTKKTKKAKNAGDEDEAEVAASSSSKKETADEARSKFTKAAQALGKHELLERQEGRAKGGG